MTSNTNYSLLQSIRAADNKVDGEIIARVSADDALSTSISDEKIARVNADDALSASISDEKNARVSADDALTVRINDEEITRQNADEDLQTNINTENSRITALTTAVSKIGFISTAEVEGLLDIVNNPYPFGFGYGSPSGVAFGLPIPFSYRLDSIAYVSKNTAEGSELELDIYHQEFGESEMIKIGSFKASGFHKVEHFTNVMSNTPGNLLVKLSSVFEEANLEITAKYRISFVIASLDVLETPSVTPSA
jgi:hypothetical protein